MNPLITVLLRKLICYHKPAFCVSFSIIIFIKYFRIFCVPVYHVRILYIYLVLYYITDISTSILACKLVVRYNSPIISLDDKNEPDRRTIDCISVAIVCANIAFVINAAGLAYATEHKGHLLARERTYIVDVAPTYYVPYVSAYARVTAGTLLAHD